MATEKDHNYAFADMKKLFGCLVPGIVFFRADIAADRKLLIILERVLLRHFIKELMGKLSAPIKAGCRLFLPKLQNQIHKREVFLTQLRNQRHNRELSLKSVSHTTSSVPTQTTKSDSKTGGVTDSATKSATQSGAIPLKSVSHTTSSVHTQTTKSDSQTRAVPDKSTRSLSQTGGVPTKSAKSVSKTGGVATSSTKSASKTSGIPTNSTKSASPTGGALTKSTKLTPQTGGVPKSTKSLLHISSVAVTATTTMTRSYFTVQMSVNWTDWSVNGDDCQKYCSEKGGTVTASRQCYSHSSTLENSVCAIHNDTTQVGNCGEPHCPISGKEAFRSFISVVAVGILLTMLSAFV
ncbi:uncharacterized protein LOC144633527 [Oculina patagonica]